MEQLCRSYWFPLYAFARRAGHPREEAQDLTQGFFEQVIQSGIFAKADVSKGRFRSFLLGCFKNYAGSRKNWIHARKRGGAEQPINMEFSAAEERCFAHLAKEESPEKIFEHAWACSVLENALSLLAEEYERKGRKTLFDQLVVYLQNQGASPAYEHLAAALGASTGAVKLMVFRMRQRYRELLRAVVAQTVDAETDIDEEMRYLLKVLAS